jgi:hypothetical protein
MLKLQERNETKHGSSVLGKVEIIDGSVDVIFAWNFFEQFKL